MVAASAASVGGKDMDSAAHRTRLATSDGKSMAAAAV